ncbi:MAG: hypothetical protein COA60_000845 [Robiginitomaculum sp.]|nr:hypothetical protein [Robiginitomaculum sp.]
MTEIFAKSQINNLRQIFANTANKSGVSFDFLLKTAARESSMRPEAKAKTSSAAGLFQFVEQTWLSMVSKYGKAHGLGDEANAIKRNDSGKFEVKDATTRSKILDLRHDPAISTAMAAQLTVDNAAQLAAKLGRAPNDAELYVAHFMGSGAAASLLKAASDTPDIAANKLFPTEAKANRAIFFDNKGKSRSIADVAVRLQSLHLGDLPAANILGAGSSVSRNSDYSSKSIAAFPLASTMVRAPLMQLSPMLIQLLSELSLPSSVASKDKNNRH